MNKKFQHSGLYYILGPNAGTWVLIFVHLVILFALIILFSSIIAHMQNY